MKTLAALLFVFAFNNAIASEVGTQNPQIVEAAENTLALAVAEKGAGERWATEPMKFMATAHQTAELAAYVEKLNKIVSEDLDAIVAEKIKALINQ
jgi:hypothetical protein